MDSFRFFHAADIHLDSPLKGLAVQEGNVAERVRSATRDALIQLVDLAIEEKVDFLIIAGDLYDGDWRDYKTGLFFAEQMGRLRESKIPVYLLHGNHDAESQITKRLELPENVYVFSSKKPESFKVDAINVYLHGHSYNQRDITNNLARQYPEPVVGFFNIGVLHTGLGGIGGHANYAPCTMDDLINRGYDYWALGHVHQTQVLHEHPYIVFPGNLQGRHVRETGTKGACLVTVQGNEIIDLTVVPCDVVRWAVVRIALDDADSLGEVISCIQEALESAVAGEADGRLLTCRIVLEGRCSVHSHLIASEEWLVAEARASALGLGDGVAWVEKLVIDTVATLDPQLLAQREDAIGELQRMLEEAADDETLIAQLESNIDEMVRRLPHDVRMDIDDPLLKLAVEGDRAGLIRAVGPYLSARLLEGED